MELVEPLEEELVEVVESVLENEPLELAADKVFDDSLDESVEDDSVEEPLELLVVDDMLLEEMEEVVPVPA